MKQDDNNTITILSGLKNIWWLVLGICGICGLFISIKSDNIKMQEQLKLLPQIVDRLDKNDIKNNEQDGRIVRLETLVKMPKEQ